MVPVCAVAAAFVVSGCGASSERDPVQDVATRFVTAVARSDAATACSLIAPRAVRRMKDKCAQVLPTFGLPSDRPDSIQVWGDTAQARTSGDTLFLRRFADGWRIVAAGCVPHGEDPYECEVDGT